jgi:hypothetical protein
MTELKTNIEPLAIEILAKEAEETTDLEIISMLQAAAAEIDDNETLEALCAIKWCYI